MAPGGDQEVGAGEAHVKTRGVGCSIIFNFSYNKTHNLRQDFFFLSNFAVLPNCFILKLKLECLEDTKKL